MKPTTKRIIAHSKAVRNYMYQSGSQVTPSIIRRLRKNLGSKAVRKHQAEQGSNVKRYLYTDSLPK